MKYSTPECLKAVKDYLEANPTHGGQRLAKALQIPRRTAFRLAAKVREKPIQRASKAAPPEDLSNANAIEHTFKRIATLEDLLKHAKVDREKWDVDHFIVNKHEVVTKNEETGAVTVTPLYQVKAWLKPKAGSSLRDALKDICDELRAHPVTSRVPGTMTVAAKVAAADSYCFEFSAPDLHVGKLTWAPEVGTDYDLRIAPLAPMAAAKDLWAKASVYPVTKILLPIGNDFFNVNNAAGETAAGTPQDEDGREKKSFKVGIKLATDLIEFFRGRTAGGIDVMIVPGNHDPERIYYLGCVLEALYDKTKDVRIDNSPNPRKYFRFGTNLLGFTHGHGEKHDKLPLVMAGERPKDWSETTHREFHLGHLHHMRETRYHAGMETGPVRVRVLPSLCPADEWHHISGYVGNKRAAEAYLWSFKKGYTGHLSYSVN